MTVRDREDASDLINRKDLSAAIQMGFVLLLIAAFVAGWLIGAL